MFKKFDKLWDFLYSVFFPISYRIYVPKGLVDFTVLIRNNIEHATVYISARHAHV